MKKGIPMNEETTERVLIAIETNKTVTIEFIKRWLNKRYKTSYSWNTIRHHINKLIEQEKVKEEVISQDKRKVSVFKLSV